MNRFHLRKNYELSRKNLIRDLSNFPRVETASQYQKHRLS